MYYKAGVGFVHPEWKQIEILEDKLTAEREQKHKIERILILLLEYAEYIEPRTLGAS